MKPSVAELVATGTGSVLGATEALLVRHPDDVTTLVIAVPGGDTADVERATGISEVGGDLGEQGHVHSTWLSRTITRRVHWRDSEAGLMWLVVPL